MLNHWEGEGWWVNILSSTADNTFNPPPFIPPCAAILTLLPRNHQNRFSPKKALRNCIFPLQTSLRSYKNTTSQLDIFIYDNAIFSLFESPNEFRRVLIKSEANPPAPPSDGRHEYSRSFQPATKSWKNSSSTTCPLPH